MAAAPAVLSATRLVPIASVQEHLTACCEEELTGP